MHTHVHFTIFYTDIGDGIRSSTENIFAENYMKFADLPTKILFLTTNPHKGGVKYHLCARNCMKCTYLHRKIMFLKPTPWGGIER